MKLVGVNPFTKLSAMFGKGSTKLGTRTLPSYIDRLAHRILTTAKEKVPVITGALRASGRVEMTTNPRQRVVSFGGIGTNVLYAQVVEFGRFSYAPFLPRPYLRPALLKEVKSARKDLKKSLEESLKDFDGHFGILRGGGNP